MASSVGCLFCLVLPISCALGADARGDALAKSAYEILKTNCYSCHGAKLVVPDFNILNRDFLLRQPEEGESWLIKPGEPEASRVWQRLAVDRDMPPEDITIRPSAADAEVLRKWIQEGARFPVTTARSFVHEELILKLIKQDLDELSPADRPFQRYFTLTHLHNNPAVTDSDLALSRAGFVKLLNSVSRSSALVFPKLVDASDDHPFEGNVFRVDLRDVNWDLETWKQVVGAYPYGLVPRDPQRRELVQDLERLWGPSSSDGIPHIRADWFVFAASRGDAYHTLLGLPPTAQELEKQLGVDLERDFRENGLRRAGFGGSGISRHNRLIDRNRSSAARYYYRSYDFGKSSGRTILYRFPLGPQRENHPFPDAAFEEDGGEIIWSLPNGLQGYLIVDREGKRLNDAPIQIVRDLTETSGSPVVSNGISCIGCHRDGLHRYRDSVRHWSALSGQAQEKVERLFASGEVIDAMIAADSQVFMNTLERLIGPYLRVGADANKPLSDFPEPVTGLVRLYYRDLTLAEVAYELGYSQPTQLPLEGNARLRELGLLPLSAGGKIARNMWDSRADTPASLFQQAVVALGLGSGINP